MDIQSIVKKLPKHLRRYIVDQDYSRYTPIDQACWRYIMRRLTNFLSKKAHPVYLEGLAKTGIEVDHIPEIARMNDFLVKFGWNALPVSGFIPPAAFMELQSLSILPIASDMRTVDHILYTPAPDIVHEAAGHAPILVDQAFAGYLKKYAQVASKAIISHEDIELYEAIRNLSDIKEDPRSTPQQIKEAEKNLETVSAKMSHVSEAGLLSRMNWWTAEYGLIGDLSNPKIFGAGLLSSVGEAESCYDPKVKKIPLTVECIDYYYNITEPQPQLFVTPTFEHLEKVLEDLANLMAFRIGGGKGLEKALLAKTVNTVEYNSGLQISGVLDKIHKDSEGAPIYLGFSGPCALALEGRIISGQGLEHHPQGFGSPVGKFKSKDLKEGETTRLEFASGVIVEGLLKNILRNKNQIALLTFANCTVKFREQTLFDPSWGIYDMAVGEKIVSVFGGPADRESFDDSKDFAVKIIPKRIFSSEEKSLHALYARVREIRERKLVNQHSEVASIIVSLGKDHPQDWLLLLEIFELAQMFDGWEAIKEMAHTSLIKYAQKFPKTKEQIEDGMELASTPTYH